MSESQYDVVAEQKTSEIIIEIMKVLTQGGEYGESMMEALETLNKVVHADRVYLLEHQTRLDSRFFEYCAEGVPPRIADLARFSDTALAAFVGTFRGTGIIYADTLDKMGIDDLVKGYFMKRGVFSELIVPLRENGRFVGAICADNYSLDENLDAPRLLETISPFLATVISNHQLLEELEWSGEHDALTELMNRRGIDAAISEYQEKNPGAPFTLALIDVDDFKATNDRYGHAAGDEALCAIAQTMRDCFPTGAFLGRNGGDEMLVILTGEASKNADELILEFSLREMSIECDGQTIPLTVSIGYTTYPDQAESLAVAYNQADMAMYAVKLAGKSSAKRHSDEMGSQYRSLIGFTPRDIADNTPAAVMVHRAYADGKILFVNNEMIRLLDCDDVADFIDFTGMDYRNVMHPDDNERVHENAEAQLAQEGSDARFSVDYRIVTKSGATKDVAVNGHLVDLGESGKVFYILFVDKAGHSFA